MESRLIVLDFETTGMSPNVGSRPTEVDAVHLNCRWAAPCMGVTVEPSFNQFA